MKKLTFLPQVVPTTLFLAIMILFTSCGKGWTQHPSSSKNDLSYKATWNCQFMSTMNKTIVIENCSLTAEEIGKEIPPSDLKNFEYRMKNIAISISSPFVLVPATSGPTKDDRKYADIAGSRYELNRTAETETTTKMLKNRWSATHLIQTSKTASKKTEEKMTVTFPNSGVLSNQVVIEFRLMVVSEPVPRK